MKRVLLPLLLVLPGGLAAQDEKTTVSSYISTDNGVPGGPMLVGVTAAREAGWTAVRVGAATDAGSTLFGSSGAAGSVGVLSAEMDAMLFGLNPTGPGPVIPYLMGGLGGRLLSGASTASALTYSYGAGVRAPLGTRLAMEGEVRYREPMVGGIDPTAGTVKGIEYRFGMAVRLGAAPLVRSAPAVPAVARRAVEIPSGASAGTALSSARLRVAERTLDTADDFLGTRYTWGGNTPEEGFDCSGFVRYVFRRHGIDLPRVSRDQARAGQALPLDIESLEPGDLVAFAPAGGEVNHIAIYAGNGQIIHSSSSGRGVRVDDLYSQRGRWYRTHMVAARRVIDGPVLLGGL